MLTREQGPAIALLALTFRIMEAIHEQSAIFFAVGSLLFCWLLLRGRMIPAALAWLGVIASALLVVILPLQLAGVLTGTGWSDSITWFVWLPMLVFEVTFSIWLFVKGVRAEK
jgi:ABC-type glycerol-3-phosphate transport system permease component